MTMNEAVAKVQRRGEALEMDLRAKDIAISALQSEVEWGKATAVELEQRVHLYISTYIYIATYIYI